MDSRRLTVAICTWNRCELLRRTLQVLSKVHVPESIQWEVIVVNNNCTDATSEVIRSFVGRLPIQEAKEQGPGLSSARNRAIKEATGDYLCWIDDDIFVDRAWLEEYARAIHEWPDASVFGGTIEPEFDGKPPAWLVEALPVVGGVFGVTQGHTGPIAANSKHLPFGGNMVIKSDVLRRSAFDPRFGRTAGNLMAGEETVLIRQILHDGAVGRWVPGARVKHYVPRRMQTLRHIRRYFHDWGASLALTEQREGQRLFLRRPLWMWRQAIYYECAYRVGKWRSPPEQWVESLRLASMAWGGLRRRPARVSKA